MEDAMYDFLEKLLAGDPCVQWAFTNFLRDFFEPIFSHLYDYFFGVPVPEIVLPLFPYIDNEHMFVEDGVTA